MALKLSGSISLTGSLASDSSIEATVVSSSFFTGSYLDGLGNSGSADEVLISDGTGASVYQEINFLTNQGVTPASINEFSISWEGGLNFSASALKVFGPGESFSRKQLDNKLLTLSSADSTNPRFDVFVFRINENDITSGSIEVIEGTPNANPVYPNIDGNTEVPLKFVLIKAGASLPSDGSNEDDTNTSDFSSANIYSDNAFDGNTWYTHGTSDTGANVSGSIFFFSANNQKDYEYGNTVHGTAIKWPRTGYYNKFARAARIAFAHPSWESNGGIAVGDLDQLKLDIKFPSATTGDTSIAKAYRTQVYSNMYIEVWLYSGVQKSNGTYSVTTVAKSRINIGRTLDLTSDQFQTVTIDQAAMQKYNAGKVTSGTKINYIVVNFYKNQWPYNANGLGVPIADGLFIDNITWVNGSGASPQLDPQGKSISKATASEPVALSGKNNNASGTSSAIVAGENNTITTNRSFIGAGRSNFIAGNTDSVIGGGSFNSSSNSCTFIGGGSNNIVTGSGTNAIVVGGTLNTGSGACSFIGGGEKNNVTGSHSSIVGGQCNGICGTGTLGCNIIGGGFFNRILNGSCRSGILGGTNNTLSGKDSSFIIGTSITATADCTTYMNNLDVEGTVSGSTFSGSFVGDGSGLTGISGGGGADDDWYDGTTYISSSVGIRVTGSISGEIASATGPALTVGYQVRNVGQLSSALGFNNYLCASQGAFIGGGQSNKICAGANYSIIGAGNNNLIHSSSGNSGIFNGQFNKVTGSNSNVVGGCCNNVGSVNSLIGGGARNLICTTAVSSSILGGFDNTTACTNSHIIGSGLTADKPSYTFMNNLDVAGTVSGSIFSGSFVGSGFVSSSAQTGSAVTEIITLAQSQYDALTPASDVLYVIV